MYHYSKNLSEQINAMSQSDAINPIWESRIYAQRSIAQENELKSIEKLPLTFVLDYIYVEEQWFLSVFYFLIWVNQKQENKN